VPQGALGLAFSRLARPLSLALLLIALGAPVSMYGAQADVSWNLIHSDGSVTNPSGAIVGYFPGTEPPAQSNPDPVQWDPQPSSSNPSDITWNLIHSDGRITNPAGETVGQFPGTQPPASVPYDPTPVSITLDFWQRAAANQLDMGLAQEGSYPQGKALSITASMKNLVQRVAGKTLTDQQALNFYNAWVMRNKYTREQNSVINAAKSRTSGPIRDVWTLQTDARGNQTSVKVSARFTDDELKKMKVGKQGIATSSTNLWRIINAPDAPMVQMSPYEGQTWDDFAVMRFLGGGPYQDVSTRKAGALAVAVRYEQLYYAELNSKIGPAAGIRGVNGHDPTWIDSNHRTRLKQQGFSDAEIDKLLMARMGVLVAQYNQNAIAHGEAALPYHPVDGQPWKDWYNKVDATVHLDQTNELIVELWWAAQPRDSGNGPVSTFPTSPSLNNPFITQVPIPNTGMSLWFNPTIVAPLPRSPFGTDVSEGLAWGVYNPDNLGDGSSGASGVANALLGGVLSSVVRTVGLSLPLHPEEFGSLFSYIRSGVQSPVTTPPVIPRGNG